MRVRTAFTVVLLSGLAWTGVPSAAADELPPTPAETSEVTGSAEEPVAEPTAEPSDVPTSEVTTAEPEGSAEPTEEPAEPTGEESPSPAEPTGEPTEEADPTEPAEEIGETPSVEEGDAPFAGGVTVAERAMAAAVEEVRDPRASIGDINCTNLTVPVTLDNSRSTVTETYQVLSGNFESEEGPSFETVQVLAGAIRTVTFPLTGDTFFGVEVYVAPAEEFMSSVILTSTHLVVDCTEDDDPHDPQARIGGVDCPSLSVDVTLDNSRSEDEANYSVFAFSTFEDEPGYDQRFTVPAGAVQAVLVPATENATVVVSIGDEIVSGELGDELASELFRVDCTPGDEPLADIGEVNCTNLTVPVSLDNARSSRQTGFVISAGDAEDEFFIEYEEDFLVAAGTERVVAVPVHNNAEVQVVVLDQEEHAFTLGGIYAAEVLEVNCPRTAARPIPTVAVEGAKLPQTGGFNVALPLLGVALLGTGGLLVLAGRRRRP